MIGEQDRKANADWQPYGQRGRKSRERPDCKRWRGLQETSGNKRGRETKLQTAASESMRKEWYRCFASVYACSLLYGLTFVIELKSRNLTQPAEWAYFLHTWSSTGRRDEFLQPIDY